MAGLTAAHRLQSAGRKVTVVDKARGVGGRMATRRLETSRLDHGAQFFTARDERLIADVEKWLAEGVVKVWYAQDGHQRYCGTDGMSGIPKYLAKGVDVQTSSKIVQLESADGGWRAEDETGSVFEAAQLILTPPVEQSLALCESFRPLLGRKLVQSLQSIHFEPCYALMALVDGPSNVPSPGCLKPEGTFLSWVADNTQKGISEAPGAALTLHADSRFTIEHWDDEPAEVAQLMIAAAAEWPGGPGRTWQLHRWRYGTPVRVGEALFLKALCPGAVYFAGDAFGGPRVEGAYLSGLETAEDILRGPK